MPVASKIVQYFNRFGVSYQALHHTKSAQLSGAIKHAQADPNNTIKSYLLVDHRGPIQVVIPYLSEPNIAAINETLNRRFQRVPDVQAEKFYKDCDPGIFPAFGMAYGLPVIVDADLLEKESIYAPCGCSSTMLKLKKSAFQLVMKGAIRGKISIASEKGEKVMSENRLDKNLSLAEVAKKLERIYKLPPMPETAVRIMHMVSDPDVEIKDLSELIERDPSLSAQVMRYARSALFAYPGELDNVQEAINRVLGFDRVSQLAMGLAASKAFKIPDSGPLGLKMFWKHALYAGVLNQALAEKIGADIDPKQAYLAGLLHNFGVLLIGHLFPPEFQMLNRLRANDPDALMSDLEQQVFGVGGAQEFIVLGHSSMGAILLKLWNLPDSVIKVAGMHQQEVYEGEMQQYVRLTRLTNYFLAQEGIGDEPVQMDIEEACADFGIAAADIEELASQVIERCRSLDSIASNMAA